MDSLLSPSLSFSHVFCGSSDLRKQVVSRNRFFLFIKFHFTMLVDKSVLKTDLSMKMRLWKCNFWVNEIRISHIARDTRAWTCAHNPKLCVRSDNIKYTIHVKMGHFIHVDGSIDVKKIQWEFFLPYSKSNALTFEARDFEIMLLNLLLQALEKVGSLFAVHGQLSYACSLFGHSNAWNRSR